MKYILRRTEVHVSELVVEANAPMEARAIGDASQDWEYVSYDDAIQVRPSGEEALQQYLEENDVSDPTIREIFGR